VPVNSSGLIVFTIRFSRWVENRDASRKIPTDPRSNASLAGRIETNAPRAPDLGGIEDAATERGFLRRRMDQKDSSTRSCRRKSGNTSKDLLPDALGCGRGFLNRVCALEEFWKTTPHSLTERTGFPPLPQPLLKTLCKSAGLCEKQVHRPLYQGAGGAGSFTNLSLPQNSHNLSALRKTPIPKWPLVLDSAAIPNPESAAVPADTRWKARSSLDFWDKRKIGYGD
jgi:hypothetical protein